MKYRHLFETKLWRREEYCVEATMMEPTKLVSGFGLRRKWNGAPGPPFLWENFWKLHTIHLLLSPPYERLWKSPTISLLWKVLEVAHHTPSMKGFENWKCFGNWPQYRICSSPLWKALKIAHHTPSNERFWKLATKAFLRKALEIAHHTPSSVKGYEKCPP